MADRLELETVRAHRVPLRHPPSDPFIRETASVGAFHETGSRGSPRLSPVTLPRRATSHKITGQ